MRLKHVATISKGRATAGLANNDQLGTPLINMAALRSTSCADWVEGVKVDCEPGEIVVCWDGSNSGEFFRSQHSGALASTIGLIKASNRIDKLFLFYLLKSQEAHLRENIVGMGIPHVNPTELKNIKVPQIDLATQRQIADFLDSETARIDLLIEKKQRLVALLGEREEATFIDHVTGKGLLHEKKRSGVEWIKEIPQHWSAPKFTQVARQETGHTPSRKVEDYWVPEECVIPWMSLADVWQLRDGANIYVSNTSEKISEIGMANSAARLLPKDTVILSRTASVGFPAIMKEPMATTQDFAAWICGKQIRPLFLYYVLRAMKPEFRRLMMGSTHQTIYMPDIRSFRTPLPPLGEQDQIIARLSSTIQAFRKSATALKKSTDRLKEYRSALITAAVTGQIDVQTYAKSGTPDRRLEAIQEEVGA
ncbi:MAG: restriction endonuclease subunit S [Paracoccaceae bacterium]